MSEEKPDTIQEIAAAVEEIAVAVDNTKAVVAAKVEAGVVVNGGPPGDLRQRVQVAIEQAGAAKWSLETLLAHLVELRDLLDGDDKKT